MEIAFDLLQYSNSGCVTISSELHEIINGRINFHEVDLGFIKLSKIAQRVRAYKISSIHGNLPKPAKDRGNLPSLAIIPFEIRDSSTEPRPLAASMDYEISALLASLREVFVVSGTSTAAFADFQMKPYVIAHQLGVQYILSGTITAIEDDINIVVELTDTDRNQVIWADSFATNISGIFDAQFSIANKITYALLPHIHYAELSRISRKLPTSLDAYDFVLKGMDHMYRLSKKDFDTSYEYFTRAVELDPHYGNAHAMLAKWHILFVGEGYSKDVRFNSNEALRLAERALENDPLNPLALAIYGHTRSFLFADYLRALDAFEKAISSSPNSAVAWGLSAPTFCYIGNGGEAIKRAEHALALSPLEAYTYFYKSTLTTAHYFNGTYDESNYWGRKTLAAAPRFVANMRSLIASLSASAEIEEAVEVAGRLLEIDPEFRVGKFCRWYPIKDGAQLEQYATHLMAAGLPK